jgi:hypothetical protein
LSDGNGGWLRITLQTTGDIPMRLPFHAGLLSTAFVIALGLLAQTTVAGQPTQICALPLDTVEQPDGM